MLIYREDADAAQCATPGCNHDVHGPLWLHAACHPEGPLKAHYQAGVLSVRCLACDKLIGEFALASRGVA